MSKQDTLTVEALRDELHRFMEGTLENALGKVSRRISEDVKAELHGFSEAHRTSPIAMPSAFTRDLTSALSRDMMHHAGSESPRAMVNVRSADWNPAKAVSRSAFGATTTIRSQTTEYSPIADELVENYHIQPTLKQDFLGSRKKALGRPWTHRHIKMNTDRAGLVGPARNRLSTRRNEGSKKGMDVIDGDKRVQIRDTSKILSQNSKVDVGDAECEIDRLYSSKVSRGSTHVLEESVAYPSYESLAQTDQLLDNMNDNDEQPEKDGSSVKRLVKSVKFERFIATLVVINAMMQGLETECQYQVLFGNHSLRELGSLLDSIEYVFCGLFVVEVSLRLYAHRCKFFYKGESWKWNVFDLTIVSLQAIERVLHAMSDRLHMKISALSLLRIARIIRISRMVRLVRTVEELQTITSSIMLSINSLFCTLLLLFMLTYSVSVLFCQTVVSMDEMPNAEIFAKIQYWFGGLPRTMLTMFEVITGGVSWDEVMHPILKDISPAMGIVLLFYITFCLFAMLNIVTGVFVETALRKAREDKDTYTANHICELFFNDEDNEDEICWETFKKKLDSTDMQEYFRSINVDPSEAHSLFRLLDMNDNNALDASELVNGCLRLRGEAKALELSLLMFETSRMNKVVLAFHSRAEAMLTHIAEVLVQFRDHAESSISRSELPHNCISNDINGNIGGSISYKLSDSRD